MTFWTDPVLSTVRGWITNDALYTRTLEPILEKRMAQRENRLTPKENEKLESVDRFCAILASLSALGGRRLTPQEAALWDRAYGRFWQQTIEARTALRRYMDIYWKDHPIAKQDEALAANSDRAILPLA